MLNTDKFRFPHWSTTKKGRLTVVPSVDYFDYPKRCHYFIRKGRVRWVK